MPKTSEARLASARGYKARNYERLLQYSKEYYHAHKEEIAAKKKAEYPEKGEKLREYSRNHHWKNREERLEKKKKYRKENPEKIHLDNIANYAKHAEDRRERSKKYKKANPQKYSSYQSKRRAQKQNPVGVEPVSLTILFTRDRKTCSICHLPVKRTEGSIDHIIPLSQGGAHSYANCTLAHRRCNSRKHTSTRFPQQLGLF